MAVKIRTFCILLRRKQGLGEEIDTFDFKLTYCLFFLPYYLLLYAIIYRIIMKFGINPLEDLNMSLIEKAVLGLIISIPIYYIVNFILKSIRKVPIPHNFTKQQIKLSNYLSISWLIIGFILLFTFSYYSQTTV